MRLIKLRINPIGYYRSIGVRIGENCNFVSPSFGSEPYLITIGDHVSVAKNVCFINHDGGMWVFREKYPDMDVIRPITVGNNVLIGLGAIIMPGVTIGDNCVIGAGSVVTRDIPSGSVAAGVPAKVLKTTEQYFESVKDLAIHDVRSLPPKEKKRILEKRFNLK
jgi:acetyltransferase-like isoleucine patch superfamily enzyme